MHYFLQYLVLQYLEPFIRNVHWLLKSSTEALVNTVDDIYFNMQTDSRVSNEYIL